MTFDNDPFGSPSRPRPGMVPGFYPDPANHAVERYWDGSQWTPETRTPAKAASGTLPWKAILSVVTALVLVAGITALFALQPWSDDSKSTGSASAPTSASVASSPEASYTESATEPAEPTELAVGDALSVTSTDDDTGATAEADVKVTKVSADSEEPGEYGETPTADAFLVIRVKVSGTTGAVTFNPNDFYVTGADGEHFEEATYSSAWGKSLTDVTVHSGETAKGTIVFDVPASARKGAIFYSPNSDEAPLGRWNYKT